MIDIAIVRSHSILRGSPRVKKIGSSLATIYRVMVLGWRRENNAVENLYPHSFLLKLFNLRAPRGKMLIVAYLPIFWFWILLNLCWYRPSLVHACDLDTVIPCYVYKIIFRKKLVFDVCDRYAMAYIRPTQRILYSSVNFLEEKFVAKADALITVSERMQASFGKKPRIAAVVLNCSDNRKMTVQLHSQNHSEKSPKIFELLYIGNIVQDRGLMQIGSAINGIENVKLIIAGPILDKPLFRRLTVMPGIQYNGTLNYENSIGLVRNSDVMMILYDPKVPNNIFSCSNKMFEAMMCGIPIITNVSSEIVKDKANCGIIVNYNDLNQLRSAIIDLQSRPQLYNELARNGRSAFLQNYNWKIMESKILKIHGDLISN